MIKHNKFKYIDNLVLYYDSTNMLDIDTVVNKLFYVENKYFKNSSTAFRLLKTISIIDFEYNQNFIIDYLLPIITTEQWFSYLEKKSPKYRPRILKIINSNELNTIYTLKGELT